MSQAIDIKKLITQWRDDKRVDTPDDVLDGLINTLDQEGDHKVGLSKQDIATYLTVEDRTELGRRLGILKSLDAAENTVCGTYKLFSDAAKQELITRGAVFDSQSQPKTADGSKSPAGMVLLEGGTFMMGSTNGDSDETPVHQVTLSAFYMDINEREDGKDYNWFEAQDYCRAQGKELPTEAQWEYAARGRSHTDERAPKGQANSWGLRGLSGEGRWEWTADNYGSYSSAAQTDPNGPTKGYSKVARGGSRFNYGYEWYTRAANRVSFAPDDHGSGVGFRCVSAAAPQDPEK